MTWRWIPHYSDGFQLDIEEVDCPVQGYVWRHLAESRAESAILEVRRGVSPPAVAMYLRSVLAGEVVAYFDYVVASITFEELVEVILPLTNWAGFLVRAGSYLERLAGEEKPPGRANVDWSLEDSKRLQWLIGFAAQAHGLKPPEPRPGQMAVPSEAIELVQVAAANAAGAEGRPIEAVGLNRPVALAAHDSRRTVKMDAAERVFDLDYRGLVWAVIDSGIDASHPAFTDPEGGGSRVLMSFDIPKGLAAVARSDKPQLQVDKEWQVFLEGADITADPSDLRPAGARNDHGTHVAGIIAGHTPLDAAAAEPLPPAVGTRCEDPAPGPAGYRGMCPGLRLVDLKVFDGAGHADERSVIVALAFLRWLNDRPQFAPPVFGGRPIAGVNISLSVPFEVDNNACGWTPVCREAERVVDAGVVVVAAAGNAGFPDRRARSLGDAFRLVSITDPGNAEGVITVGATHRTAPHQHGPIARSGRGPTADGRHKPDLLAPGIEILGPAVGGGWTCATGTSQAAAHVSGAAAAVMARFPELQGKPGRVKQILTESATDLGRLQDFQGHGLLDVLRALQSV